MVQVFWRGKTPEEKQAAQTARAAFASPDGDLITLMNVLRAYQANGGQFRWCKAHFINGKALRTAKQMIVDLRRQLTNMGKRGKPAAAKATEGKGDAKGDAKGEGETKNDADSSTATEDDTDVSGSDREDAKGSEDAKWVTVSPLSSDVVAKLCQAVCAGLFQVRGCLV